MYSSLKIFVKIFLGLIILSVVTLKVQAQEVTRVRFVHAIPNAPNTDIYVDGNPIQTNLAYRGISQYISVAAGEHTVRFVQAGTGPEGRTLAPDTRLPYTANQTYTLALLGRLNEDGTGGEIRQFVDDLTLPPAGRARVRVFYAAPVDNVPVDVCLVPSDNCIATNLTFRNAGPYPEIGVGTYTVNVRRSGTDAIILTAPNQTFEGIHVYTLFLMGIPDNQSVPLEIIKHVDVGRVPPPNAPDTGAFLSPTAWAVVIIVSILFLGGAILLIRRRYVKLS